jgi:hypothetical protein
MLQRRHLWAFVAVVSLATARFVIPSDQPSLKDEPNLTEEQKAEFLLNAKIVNSKEIGTGITHPWRLTLNDGKITHDAAFQGINEHKNSMSFSDGHTEMNFKDSYHFDIAGYELAKLLGMDDMVPVTVERKWKGNWGALSWWVPWKMMENQRRAQQIHPPDPEGWNKQMYKIRVFDELVYDTDPNLTNVLVTEDWKIWRIDFTRGFRLYKNLKSPENLAQCDRNLLEKLKKLDGDEVMEKTKPHLSKSEVQGLMARRDKIVAYFEKLVAQKGEGAVLY